MMSSDPTDASPADNGLRWRYGIIAVAMGLAAILAAVLIVLLIDRTDASPILGIVISPIAAITGAYFGIQVSSGAVKDAQDRAADAEDAKDKALADRGLLLGAMQPQAAEELSPRLHFRP